MKYTYNVKKSLSLLLAVMFTLLLCACAGNAGNPGTPTVSTPAPSESSAQISNPPATSTAPTPTAPSSQTLSSPAVSNTPVVSSTPATSGNTPSGPTPSTPAVTGTPPATLSTSSGNSAYDAAITAYNEFLKGSINAQDPNERIRLNGTVNIKDIILGPDLPTYYAFFDMNGDGIPELHLRPVDSAMYEIFTYRNGQVVAWHGGPDWESPLSNGAILYERPGGAPTHTNYIYTVLDFNGNVISEVSFAKYHSVENGGTSESADDEIFTFGDKDVTKDEWDSLTKEYLSVTPAQIQWNELTF